MALVDFTLPLAGESHGLAVAGQEQGTSGYMSNCRPRDVLEGRFRMGKRPGMKKAYAQQIGGAAAPIVFMGSITNSTAQVASESISFSTGDDTALGDTYGAFWSAQTFTTVTSVTTSYISLKLYRGGGAGGNNTVTISIRAVDVNGKPTGADLCSGTIGIDLITTSTAGAWYNIAMTTTPLLSPTTQYAIVVKCPDSGSTKSVKWRGDSTSSTYTGGGFTFSGDSGSTWTTPSTTQDLVFKVFGYGLSSVSYNRHLIAVGNSEIWYDAVAGTMSEISGANGGLATDSPIDIVEAYGKFFIVNGSIKKVLDLTNTKIVTTDAGANPCTQGMELTGGTSLAKMVVDYVDGITDNVAMNAYGYKITLASFVSGETVTGTNGLGNAVSFVLSADETANPLFYNWTPFGNDVTNYGTMLSYPTLVCLYRGRLVTAGDSTRPQAWQMSKIGNPYKVLYDYDEDADLSAVTYANNKVGLVGDIITSLIAYKDDLLIFGCANSLWGLIGDPLAGGQLAQITKDTGIWGAKSWCIAGDNSLCFLGNDGIYRMQVSTSFSAPENISITKLPELMKTLDLDKSLHRVTLSYDPVNKGIIISKTLISDGTNTNYWYDLTTGGFFSESYPLSCGIFSSCYYPATDETYKKFLVGCTDGYIREFDNATKDDATTASTAAIDSYCTMLKLIGSDEESSSLLRELVGVLAGGASSGAFTDSDGVTCNLYTGNSAETVLENIKDGDTPFYSITWSTTGKSLKSRPRMKGVWCGIKLQNNTASQSWAIERLYADIEPKGKR